MLRSKITCAEIVKGEPKPIASLLDASLKLTKKFQTTGKCENPTFENWEFVKRTNVEYEVPLEKDFCLSIVDPTDRKYRKCNICLIYKRKESQPADESAE